MTTPPAPVTLTELKLIDEMKTAVNGALLNRTPIVFAYVDGDGQPSLSFRGSTQAYSDDQLAVWVRNPEGGLLAALAGNNRFSLLYRNPENRTTLQFKGQGRIDESEAVRQTVYTNSPEQEQASDKEQKGQAMIIDLDSVEGRVPGFLVKMRR